MKKILAYLALIIVWSTTPLAIKWSSLGVGYLFSVSSRMCLAACLILPLAVFIEKRLPLDKQSLLSYAAGSLGIFVAMLSVYYANPYLPSGVLSVLIGLTPLFTGVCAYWVLNEPFGLRKIGGVLISLLGLMIIFYDGLSNTAINLKGVAFCVFAAFMMSVSAVLVKRVQAPITPLQQTTGTLVLSAICYLITWQILGHELPSVINLKAAASLAYLVVVCSVFGFLLFYYVLSTSSAGAVSLINLVTPVSALCLGFYFNDEAVNPKIIMGAACIGSGLILYQFGAIMRMIHHTIRPNGNAGYIDPYQGWVMKKKQKNKKALVASDEDQVIS